ncbi:c-type cytochrome [Rhizobiales bacterium L72]|uniref:C-type cytochrome n=2 Tax=Propylenella binzhouense TaxID=2555902 RepID=A0A964T6V9_9HYPH|nr:c-type cytochrome [Propylenella binzhouense]
MFAAAAAIFLLVLALALFAVFARPERRRWLGGRVVVIAGGVAFPVIALSALLVFGLSTLRALDPPPAPGGIRIEVTGRQWWWEVRYLDAEGGTIAISANEVRMPVGVPVEFVLKSADVIHSFWVPSLAGKLDMIPGRVNSYRFAAGRPGIYRGQCAEYCGAEHALMAFFAVAMEPAAFRDWMARERGPAAAPGDAAARRGAEVFLNAGCAACHTIRGTEAKGAIGPDLTHVGGRVSLAAGTLPNNIGSMEGWIASSQHIKPGNFMPSFDVLSSEDLVAVAAYLESLR